MPTIAEIIETSDNDDKIDSIQATPTNLTEEKRDMATNIQETSIQETNTQGAPIPPPEEPMAEVTEKEFTEMGLTPPAPKEENETDDRDRYIPTFTHVDADCPHGGTPEQDLERVMKRYLKAYTDEERAEMDKGVDDFDMDPENFRYAMGVLLDLGWHMATAGLDTMPPIGVWWTWKIQNTEAVGYTTYDDVCRLYETGVMDFAVDAGHRNIAEYALGEEDRAANLEIMSEISKRQGSIHFSDHLPPGHGMSPDGTISRRGDDGETVVVPGARLSLTPRTQAAE